MTAPLSVLIVEDESFSLDVLEQALEPLGCETLSARNGEEALPKFYFGFPGIIVTDIKMPRMDGLELMKRVQEIDPGVPVILLTAHGDVETAVQAMRDGAFDFIEKPYRAEPLRTKVLHALNNRSLILDNRALRTELEAKSGIEAKILGNSAAMEMLRKTVANVASADANVLIRGETGTGKEVVARALHDLGRRHDNNFVAVNCGAIPEGLIESELYGYEKGAHATATSLRICKFEHADQGTIFLDEIESMPVNTQVTLLRVLQERQIVRLGANDVIPVNVRVIAATQGDLKSASDEDNFRTDLYFRLNVVEIVIPPLRDRREDIPLLFETFSRELALQHGREIPLLSREDLQQLMAHDWPGNVRELRNMAERHVLGLNRETGSIAELVNPPETTPLSLSNQVDAFEKCVLDQALTRNMGNIQATAEMLGLPTRTLNDRMRKHGLIRKDYAEE